MNLTEKWQLRWEYLARSENYRFFCSVENDPDYIPDDDLLFSYLRANYRIFGDIYKVSFDDWWKTNRRSAVKNEYLSYLKKDGKDVLIYAGLIKDDMNNYRKRYKNDPSLNKFIDDFSRYLQEVRWLYIRINPLCITKKEMSNQIWEVLKEKLNDPSMRLHAEAISKYDNPQNVRISSLKKYLRVYDLKKEGKSTRQIIETIGTKKQKNQSDDQEIQREYKRYYQKAKKIIKNVERLDFPGKHE